MKMSRMVGPSGEVVLSDINGSMLRRGRERLLVLEFSKPVAPGLAPVYDMYSFKLLPLMEFEDTLWVATADPLDGQPLAELAKVSEMSIWPLVVPNGDLDRIMRRFINYAKTDRSNEYVKETLDYLVKQKVIAARDLPEILSDIFDKDQAFDRVIRKYALDPEMIGEVLDVMRTMAKEGMTMMVVSHEMGFIREAADRILFLADGLIVEDGTPDQIFNHSQHKRTIEFLGKIL